MVIGELGMELITELGNEAKLKLFKNSVLDKGVKADFALLTEAQY